MHHARSFRDLRVYQKARVVALRFFDISKAFPKEERYSLTDQGRRSSRSIGAQIAEAWGKRRYDRHFVSKLTDADGEQQETQHWIETALDCAYITEERRNELVSELQQIGRMLSSMICKAPQFCGHLETGIGEEMGEYFVPVTRHDHRSPITEHPLPGAPAPWKPTIQYKTTSHRKASDRWCWSSTMKWARANRCV